MKNLILIIVILFSINIFAKDTITVSGQQARVDALVQTMASYADYKNKDVTFSKIYNDGFGKIGQFSQLYKNGSLYGQVQMSTQMLASIQNHLSPTSNTPGYMVIKQLCVQQNTVAQGLIDSCSEYVHEVRIERESVYQQPTPTQVVYNPQPQPVDDCARAIASWDAIQYAYDHDSRIFARKGEAKAKFRELQAQFPYCLANKTPVWKNLGTKVAVVAGVAAGAYVLGNQHGKSKAKTMVIERDVPRTPGNQNTGPGYNRDITPKISGAQTPSNTGGPRTPGAMSSLVGQL